MTSIEVSVRVRPFNSREVKFNCELVIGMPNSTTCEIKTNSSGAPKKFNFDHCLWTFKSDEESEDGRKRAAVTDVTFADQSYVYNAVGQRILTNALEGFNACLFAYGQTGSGKTYSMMGTGSDPGIIPRLAQDLFQQERNATGDDAFTLAVEVTYLEIYNENVKDLLNAKGMDKTLRVRQHPKFGVYVEGLTKWTVSTEAEIIKLLDDGGSVRSVAATKMNATSSRSHAILTLHIKKKTQNAELVSQLHLVDLAGSERASSTGAEGDTLMEGANINKSLTTLGMCLSRLAEVSGGGAKGHVPYRDSQLTWLLNDSLGGNSKTAMLANISPASINAEETLSTLRFASTVKKIKNNAVVNEDPQQRLIRELREEIADIKKKILALEMGLGPEEALDGEAAEELSDVTERTQQQANATANAALLEGILESDHAQASCSTTHQTGEVDALDLDDQRDMEEALLGGSSGVERRPGGVGDGLDDPQQGDPRDGTPTDDPSAATDDNSAAPQRLLETHEDLLERLEEDATLMLQMVESNEEKLARTQAQTADNQQAIADLQEVQISVKLTCPRLVTLNEDLHALPSVALLYYLREGDSWMGSEPITAAPDATVDMPMVLIPPAGCRPTETVLEKHLCIRVDGLRQSVHVVVPERGDDPTLKAARVYVNGHHVAPGTQSRLRHMDRVVVGLMAFRHSQPVRWTNETLKDDFIRAASSLPHVIDIEAYERMECEWAALQDLRHMAKLWASETTELACVAGQQVEGPSPLHHWLESASERSGLLMGRMAAAEEELVHRYPLTQTFLMQAALAAESDASTSTTLYDYDFAVNEVRSVMESQRREREQQHQDTMKSLKLAEEDREAQITALREELQRQESAKQATARVRLEASEADARDDVEGELYDALKGLVEAWRADRLDTRRRLEERLRSEAEQRRTLAREESSQRQHVETDAATEGSRLTDEEEAARKALSAGTHVQPANSDTDPPAAQPGGGKAQAESRARRMTMRSSCLPASTWTSWCSSQPM